MEHSIPRPSKKPRICQRCRTHGKEELSTSEHRGSCPWKDCQCGKCQTIQRENLRHSEYNRKRRAERRKASESKNYYLAHPHSGHHHLIHQTSPQPQAAHSSLYVLMPDGQATSGQGQPYIPQQVKPPDYIQQPYIPQRPPLHVPSHTHPQMPHHRANDPHMPHHRASDPQMPHHRANDHPPSRHGPPFYGEGPAHHPHPHVTMPRMYPHAPYPPSAVYVTRPAATPVTTYPAKRARSSNLDADEASVEPPQKVSAPRLSSQSSDVALDTDVFEPNGHHEENLSPTGQSESLGSTGGSSDEGSSSSDRSTAAGHAEPGPVDGAPPHTSPPPLTSSGYDPEVQPPPESCSDIDQSPVLLDEGDESAQEASLPDHYRNDNVPWRLKEDHPTPPAPLLVKLLDENPGINYHMALMYLTACGGDVDKANQALRGTRKPSTSTSSNSSDYPGHGSSDTSDIEVDCEEDRHRRRAALSRYGYRLGQPGQTTERVADSWSSSDCLSEQEEDQENSGPENPRSCRGSRRCVRCRSWFSIVKTNNTSLCARHKL
ncbi:uncharacterized protein LOC135809277 [Sycon ciliatum]|uniref:uncharacterized protein LOC135809277 n=1 Tax=Sycon ciliatum TaxID=27933 RepID=UPI0031F655DF